MQDSKKNTGAKDTSEFTPPPRQSPPKRQQKPVEPLVYHGRPRSNSRGSSRSLNADGPLKWDETKRRSPHRPRSLSRSSVSSGISAGPEEVQSSPLEAKSPPQNQVTPQPDAKFENQDLPNVESEIRKDSLKAKSENQKDPLEAKSENQKDSLKAKSENRKDSLKAKSENRKDALKAKSVNQKGSLKGDQNDSLKAKSEELTAAHKRQQETQQLKLAAESVRSAERHQDIVLHSSSKSRCCACAIM